jgi:hypothetical protein
MAVPYGGRDFSGSRSLDSFEQLCGVEHVSVVAEIGLVPRRQRIAAVARGDYDTGATFGGVGYIITDGSNLYVTDGGSIRKIVIATKVVATLAGGAGQQAIDGRNMYRSFSGITTDGANLGNF